MKSNGMCTRRGTLCTIFHVFPFSSRLHVVFKYEFGVFHMVSFPTLVFFSFHNRNGCVGQLACTSTNLRVVKLTTWKTSNGPKIRNIWTSWDSMLQFGGQPLSWSLLPLNQTPCGYIISRFEKQQAKTYVPKSNTCSTN